MGGADLARYDRLKTLVLLNESLNRMEGCQVKMRQNVGAVMKRCEQLFNYNNDNTGGLDNLFLAILRLCEWSVHTEDLVST